MDPGAEELDYGDQYGEAQKTRYQGGGAISALADDEIIGDDDEYDDLYNDVNVGENFQQMQQPMMQIASSGAGNGNFQIPKANPQESKIHVPESKERATDSSQQGRVMEINFNNIQKESFVSQVPQKKIGVNNSEVPVKVSTVAATALNQTNTNMNYLNNENNNRSADNGPTMLFVGELHWWTTDAEIESVLSQYGRVKEIKFFDERASGKSKGYCQVEFHDSISASMCKENMNGHVFNGRACVVAFASPQTIRQMGNSYSNNNFNKNQSQSQPQTQPLGRRPMNDGPGRGGGTNQQPNNGERNYGGRGGGGGWGRSGPGIVNRGPGNGPVRGRGGVRNMGGGGPGGPFGGPAFGGPMMNPQGIMGGGFDPGFMGRGGGFGGFPGSGFPGVMPSFPPMGLAGVAPHVNPAFFGRGMMNNGMMNNGMGMGMGMGMMGGSGMEGQQQMWSESMGGGGGERESSYGGEDGGNSEYGYGDGSQEKGGGRFSREKDTGSERDWSGNSERRQYRDERETGEKEVSERNYRHREESSSRSRSRSKAVPEEDYRRSRDADYGKRRRMPSE